ncbi:MAG: aldose 1-epimerase [Steroidobacteraceae bacterium]
MVDLLILRHHFARLTLVPQRGGAVRAFEWRGRNILRPTPATAGDDPFEMACFPMVPYVNRIARGRFEFGGRVVQLERNWSGDPHPIHGQGWGAPWSIATATPSDATLIFDGGADEWPWRYRCEQRFALDEEGLSIELAVENLGVTPMPAMIGLHPYFPDPAHAQMHARLPRVWQTDSAALPIGQIDTPPQWALEPRRPLGAASLDHCFAQWNGVASLDWPDRRLTMRAAGCAFLHVYTPHGQDLFCVEPQTAPPGALERGAAEAAVLAGGERLSIEVRLCPGEP